MSTPAAQSSDQAADLLQNLSLDNESSSEIPDQTYSLSVSHPGPVDSNNAANDQTQSHERSITPLLQECMDPSAYYFTNGYSQNPYYYGGYDGSIEWGADYNRYTLSDGAEIPPGMYGDNGSMMYHQGYGYAPYAPYSPATSPAPTMGHDGQLYAPQHYQYPAPYFQTSNPTSRSHTSGPTVPAQGDIFDSASTDQKLSSGETANRLSNSVTSGGNAKGSNVADVNSTYPNSSHIPSASLGRGGTFAGSHANYGPTSRNQNVHPQSHYLDFHQPRAMSSMGMYPNQIYGPYGNSGGSGFGYGSNGYNSRANGRGYYVDNNYKSRGRSNGYYRYGNENLDGLNELSRGPRARGSRTQKGTAPITIVDKGQSLPSNDTNEEGKDKLSVVPDRAQYNHTDFPVEYTDAKLFIIKSYSEDDVHKSVKYNVWASTPNGNKKLDAAYQEAQRKSSGCPIFLFFSVNTSGQFVGLAEMTSPVDFNKNLGYWQQDKWTGCFSVKWHIVKDVPNSLLKHIILEDNDYKPVTNSRDTQEVKLDKGLQMLKVFKEHPLNTCILDDFEFYEGRQKTIQEKKAKQEQLQVREEQTIVEKKTGISEEINSAASSDVNKDANGDTKPVEILENKSDTNGVSNGC